MLRITEREIQAQAMSSASFTHAETAVINYYTSHELISIGYRGRRASWEKGSTHLQLHLQRLCFPSKQRNETQEHPSKRIHNDIRQAPSDPNDREPDGPREDVLLDGTRVEEEVNDEEGRD